MPPDDPAARLAGVRDADRARGAARRARADAVELIAISKTHAAEAIAPLIAAGQRVFGENRVQEAQAKWPALREAHPDIAPHLVGQLQSNKAEEAVALFDAIHSVDRPSLVDGARQGDGQAGRRPACFVQVNIGDEPQKGGCAVADLPASARRGARRRPAARRADGVPPPTSSPRPISRCSPSWRATTGWPGSAWACRAISRPR